MFLLSYPKSLQWRNLLRFSLLRCWELTASQFKVLKYPYISICYEGLWCNYWCTLVLILCICIPIETYEDAYYKKIKKWLYPQKVFYSKGTEGRELKLLSSLSAFVYLNIVRGSLLITSPTQNILLFILLFHGVGEYKSFMRIIKTASDVFEACILIIDVKQKLSNFKWWIQIHRPRDTKKEISSYIFSLL